MAVAAVAHIFVFSAKPYQFLPAGGYGKVTTHTQIDKTTLKIEEDDEEKPAVLEKKVTEVKAPGTSVTESVQDIVVEGGQHVSTLPLCHVFHKIKMVRMSCFKITITRQKSLYRN